jgi:hypothetical protein
MEDLSNPVISLIHVLLSGIGQRFTIDGKTLSVHNLRVLEMFPKNHRHA